MIKVLFIRHRNRIGNFIARYSYFKDVKNYSVLKSLAKTFCFKKSDIPLMIEGYEMLFSHTYFKILNIAFDVDFRYGVINKKEEDTAYNIVKKVDKLTIFDNVKYYGVYLEYEVDSLTDALLKALYLASEQYESKRLIKYDFEDLISFVLPSARGEHKAYICSEFVYRFLYEMKIIKKLNWTDDFVISPNKLFFALLNFYPLS